MSRQVQNSTMSSYRSSYIIARFSVLGGEDKLCGDVVVRRRIYDSTTPPEQDETLLG